MPEHKILLNLVLCSDMGLVCETCDSLSSQANLARHKMIQIGSNIQIEMSQVVILKLNRSERPGKRNQHLKIAVAITYFKYDQ
jgi:hypothetical protein